MTDELERLHAFYTGLVRRNAPLIRWLCMRQAGKDEALCKDMIQEVLLGLWLHLDSYRRHIPEGVWIRWKVRTILFAYRRQLLPPPEELAFDVADSLAEEAFHARERYEEIAAYLTQEERQMLQRELDGYSVDEIAEQMGLTPNAVYKRRRKIYEKMRYINEKLNNR